MTTSIYNGGNFYVYLITDLNPTGTARYYIGSRTLATLVKKNIDPEDDPYMGSSSHPDMIQGLKERPNDFEKVIIEIHDDAKECLIAEEWFQRHHFAVENGEFFNGVYANQLPATTAENNIKRAETLRVRVDENGVDGLTLASRKGAETKKTVFVDGKSLQELSNENMRQTRIDNDSFKSGGLKMSETRLADIDEDGLNSFQRINRETADRMYDDVDENGLNAHQRNGFASADTLRNQVDEDGLNGLQRRANKGRETLRNQVDEDGLNGLQRALHKAHETKITTVDENGLNINQLTGAKIKQTRLNDIDENGLNSFQRASNKIKTDIDDEGLNGYQRRSKKQGQAVYFVGHKDYGEYRTVKELVAAMGGTVSESLVSKEIRCGFNTLIGKNALSKLVYLQNLDYDPVGMTYAETGFYVRFLYNGR